MDGKIIYEFIRDNRPNDLGSCIIDYVEKLKLNNKLISEKLNKYE
tara:strand:+ start:63 stop:197 length:135 start_codon:yes stop_codon:yes gene_type:complete